MQEPAAAPMFGNPEHEEVALRTLGAMLDLLGDKACLENPESLKRATRRFCTMAHLCRRPNFEHVNLARIARAFGVSKQAANLDAQWIAREFGIVAPGAHRTHAHRPLAWVRRGIDP